MSLTHPSVRSDQSGPSRIGRRWGWGTALLVGLLLFWLIRSTLVATRNPT
ncbi:hypothetical protein [Streptomyces sp. HC307]